MDNNITKDAFCATIGFFDGVHRGHQFVINRLKEIAKYRRMKSMIITFDQHPRQIVHADYVPQLITSTDNKLQLLEDTGVDHVEVLHFDMQMAQLSAKDFMQHVLHDRLGVRCLLIGYDNRFGHNRAEGFDDYAAYENGHRRTAQYPNRYRRYARIVITCAPFACYGRCV